jgi:hypothetical protein
MKRLWRLAPWFTRLILLPPTLIFALIASRYLFNPVQAAAAVGISFVSPLGLTIARVGFGAFPLACSLFTLSCLISSRRVLTGLGFVATVMSVALVVRIFGMLADGTTKQNMHLVVAELIFLALMLVGVFIERRRRQQASEATA